MGRGDKKTAKGKRTMGSYGITRKRNSDKPVVVAEKVEKVEKVVKVAKAAKPVKKTTKKETAK